MGTTTMDVIDTAAASTTEAAASGPDVALVGRRIDIGSTLTTVTLERQFDDVSQYQPFRGVAIDQMSISVSPEAIVGGTFSLVGMSMGAMAATSVSASAAAAAATNEPFAAFDGGLYENGVLTAVVTSIEVTLANNRTLQAVVGSKFSPDVFEGQAIVTGTMTVFFEDETLYNKFFNETASSIWVKLDDNNGTDFMTIVLPNVKYTGGPMDPPQEGPVPLEMPFQALEATVDGPSSTTVDTSLSIQVSNVPA